jgi:hypothetical protein
VNAALVTIRARVQSLADDVARAAGRNFRLGLDQGPAADFPGPRDMAYAWEDPDARLKLGITVGPAFFRLRPDQQEAILRHEMAHIYQYLVQREVPDPEHDADRLAEWLWGAPIHYGEDGIQTLHPGYTRPLHLPL